MRFIGTALLAGVFVLGACAGGEKKAGTADTTAASAAAAPAPESSAATPAGSTSAAGAAAGSAAAKPITGKTWEVKMLGDEKGYRYDPAKLTIKQGDGVKFVMTSGGPHDVAFADSTIPPGAAAQLTANMPNQMAPLESNFFTNPGDGLTISFAGVPKGTYGFHCIPHLAMNMKGEIVVQ